MKTRIAFVIPYFGSIPDYFDLWAMSAGKNSQFDFLIFSDLEFDVQQYDNIKIIHMTFDEVKKMVQSKFEMKVILHKPYKLCDYKVAYGYIFEEYLKGYDYWGFCDVDLIFGDISSFLSEELINEYDKLFFHGHFSLQRNNEKMNTLFMKKYENVWDYKYAFRTKHSCHFDENGTLAYANEYDDVKMFFKWCFYDVNCRKYQMINPNDGTEACCIWEKGKLIYVCNYGKCKQEVMYVHLQKRKMKRNFNGVVDKMAIIRDEFIELTDESEKEILMRPLYEEKEEAFNQSIQKRLKKNRRNAFFDGGIKSFIYRKVKKIRIEKNMSLFK